MECSKSKLIEIPEGFFPKLLLLFTPWRSLRAKFIVVIIIIQISLMVLVSVIIERQQREMILHESRKRAFSLANNLAALSEGYLMSYNFIKLEQTVEQIAAEEDVAYAIVQLHDGRVAAYSGHSAQQGKILDDPVSQQAIKAERPIIQKITSVELGGKGYDVAIPLFISGGTRKWGTIRLGFSLAQAISEIQKTTRHLFLLGMVAILLGTGGAIFLAWRISKPIQQLVTGVNEVAKGNYDHPIAVASPDEIGYLAQRFEEMREALRLHISRLAEEKQHLEQANKTIKQTQEQLIQHEKLAAVGRLAAKVAHEVNNPLAIIKTSIHIINKTMPDEDPNKENLDIVEEEIERIARIIKQLRDFVRPSTEVTTLQINEVIRNLLKFVEGDLAIRGIESKLELAADLPTIRMSLDQLKQVLLNLIKNAQEAMPQGGTLLIQTTRQKGGLTINVTDNGIGVPEEHLHLLFEPFFSTKKNGEGMGLGLSVSSSIVKSYGGSIVVESQPGKGTMFRVFLPEYPLSMIGESFPGRGRLWAEEEQQA